MKTFDRKTVLITGASSGIGEALARALARHRTTLLLTARSAERLDALAVELRAQGATVATFPLDLARPGAGTALHAAVTNAGYQVDLLVNNAGFGKFGPFVDIPAADVEEMITLNVTNLVVLTRLCVPAMLARGDAGILNVGSTAGFQALPYFSVYAATKAFVLSFSEALHAEYRSRGITVTYLAPGPTVTRFAGRAGVEWLMNPALSERPEKVARVALRALLRQRMVRVSGVHNRIGAFLGRVVPPRWVVRLVGRALAPKAP